MIIRNTHILDLNRHLLICTKGGSESLPQQNLSPKVQVTLYIADQCQETV